MICQIIEFNSFQELTFSCSFSDGLWQLVSFYLK